MSWTMSGRPPARWPIRGDRSFAWPYLRCSGARRSLPRCVGRGSPQIWAEWNLIVKGDKSHIVYLPEPARDILRRIPRIDGCDLVFTTTGKTPISGFSGAKELLLDSMAKARPTTAKTSDRTSKLAPWWLHDFRRTGASVLAKLGFDPVVIDKILSHKPQKLRGVAGIYQRYDYAREQKRG